jgi:addiction module HigA family antidote
LTKKLKPVHPGRILRETVLPAAGISVSDAARALGETDHILHNILDEQMPLSAALCLKIARLFNSSPEMWIRLQASYDLQQALLDETLAESLQRIVPAIPRPQAVA